MLSLAKSGRQGIQSVPVYPGCFFYTLLSFILLFFMENADLPTRYLFPFGNSFHILHPGKRLRARKQATKREGNKGRGKEEERGRKKEEGRKEGKKEGRKRKGGKEVGRWEGRMKGRREAWLKHLQQDVTPQSNFGIPI